MTVAAMLADRFVHYKRFGRFKQLFDGPPIRPRSLESFPRVLHVYWDQGIDQAPELVRECFQSWRVNNPGWTVRMWDADSARQIVDRQSLPQDLKTTPYSDVLRTCILDEHGGVWVDATVYCTRSLDGWLPVLMSQSDFFAFRRPGRDREISSWFLASHQGGYMVRQLRGAVTAYWKRQSRPTRVYHWYHYLFEYLVRTSTRFRRAWQQTPALSAVPMIVLQDHLAAGSQPQPAELDLIRAAPMHKLTYKKPQNLDQLRRILAEPGTDRRVHPRGAAPTA